MLMYFVIFPDQFDYLKQRLKKVCDSVGSHSIELPHNKSEIYQKLKETKKLINEIRATVKLSEEGFDKYLAAAHYDERLGGVSKLALYELFLKKSRLVFRTINKFKKDHSLYVGYFWVPSKCSQKLKEEFQDRPQLRNVMMYEVKDISKL